MLIHKGIYVYFRKDIYECMPELQKFYLNVTKVLGLENKKLVHKI